MEYKIYIIRNKVNKKVYIGQTYRTIEERFYEHTICKTKTKIHNAMRKHGVENFYCELLEGNIVRENVNEREQYYIALYDSYYNGYNSTLGGDRLFTPVTINEEVFKELYETKLTEFDLGRMFGVTDRTIRNMRKRLNLKGRTK